MVYLSGGTHGKVVAIIINEAFGNRTGWEMSAIHRIRRTVYPDEPNIEVAHRHAVALFNEFWVRNAKSN